jgi:hypothetical protein
VVQQMARLLSVREYPGVWHSAGAAGAAGGAGGTGSSSGYKRPRRAASDPGATVPQLKAAKAQRGSGRPPRS